MSLLKKIFLPALALIVVVSLAWASQESRVSPVSDPSAPLVLEMTIGDPQSSQLSLLGQTFKHFVEEKSPVPIKIELVYSGVMDEDEAFQFHRVQTGRLAMALGGIGNLVPMSKPLGILTLPYLFADENEVVRGTTGAAAEILDTHARASGLRILAWTYCGFRHISNSKHPIASPDDMKGLRFRVPQSMVMLETYRAFGAVPSTIPWNMTHNALKHDLVDGQCYDYSGFQVMNFQEAGQKYITEIHHLYNLQPLVMSETVFAKLSPEVQDVLVQAGQHAQTLSLQSQKEMSQKAKLELVAQGIQITSLTDETPWKDIARTVWPEVIESLGDLQEVNNYLKACNLPLWEK